MFLKGAKETIDGIRVKMLMKKLEKFKVDVGFNESSGSYEDGPTVAEVAAWNEYGTERSPARPFQRRTFEDCRDDIVNYTNNMLKVAIHGGGAKELLNSVGAYTKGKMQKEIRDGDWEPNAPSTIAKKGSSKPLIDTGRMRQSIVYTISKK